MLKIAPVHVGAYSTLGDGVVPLYGARIGESTIVAPRSVVMKQERLLAGLHYEGVPTKRQAEVSERPGRHALPAQTTQFSRVTGALSMPKHREPRHATVTDPPTTAIPHSASR